MILTVTDFGIGSPYLGQMRAALRSAGADCEVIDLVADLTPYRIEAAAHFLASQVAWFPRGAIFLGVVDPGVGSARCSMVLQADGQWFVGPDNGLFDVVAARASVVEKYRIEWVPEQLSATFHGRDLFAPIAAALHAGQAMDGKLQPIEVEHKPSRGEDYAGIIYFDCYGNAMTGLRAGYCSDSALLEVAGRRLSNARTFSDMPIGTPFWYCNSVGLIEVAVNQGNAQEVLQLKVEEPLSIC